MGPKSGLDCVEICSGGEPFNRPDFGAIRLVGEHGASFCRLTVHLYQTSAAARRLTTDMGPGQVHAVADRIYQCFGRPGLDRLTAPIDDQLDLGARQRADRSEQVSGSPLEPAYDNRDRPVQSVRSVRVLRLE